MLVVSQPSSGQPVHTGELLVSGSGEDATATVVCRFDRSVATEAMTWSNPISGLAVGPAFASNFQFVPRAGGRAFAYIPEHKGGANVTGSVTGVNTDSSTGVTSAQLLFPHYAYNVDLSYHVQYRCPDGSGPYKATIYNTRARPSPDLELGFTIAPGKTSLGGLTLYSDVRPFYDGSGYTFPFLLVRDPQPEPVSSDGSFDIRASGQLIAADGSAAEHVVHITGKINGQGDAIGALESSGLPGALDGRWYWHATTGLGALAVPLVSRLKHPAANQGVLMETASLVYPGGLGYDAKARLATGGLTGAPPGPAVYQPPNIGITLPDDPGAGVWGVKEDDRDSATLVYAVSADAPTVFNWYMQQLSQRGWAPGSKTTLEPLSQHTLVLEMVQGSLDLTVTARQFPSCLPAYCDTVAHQLKWPMLLTVRATEDTSATVAAQPVAFAPLCPRSVGGATIVLKGTFSGTAESTCLGLWTSKTPDAACSGIMELNFVIGGIPFRMPDLREGQTARVYAFAASDVWSATLDSSRVPSAADQPVRVSGGTLTLNENLYWDQGASPVGTISVRVPCEGLWRAG